jgi:GTP-binding protein
LGRSNVGKSSLLNALMGVSGLAKTSARPGCTQLINFYQMDEVLRFADLPGYGFAKVPKEITNSWKQLIDHYLTGRGSLRL